MRKSTSGDIFRQGKEMCCKFSRRDFMKTTGASLALLATPLGLTGCDEIEQLPLIDPPVGNTTVSMIKKDDIIDMVLTAMDMAGGIDEINPGDKVLIKPNLTIHSNMFNARVTTHPEVIRGVIQAVKERTDPSNITVADACAFYMSTKNVAVNNGLYDVLEEEGVQFLAWEQGKYIKVTHECFDYLKFDLMVPESLYTNDHFINIPILKNHDMIVGANADFTCCIKNHVGVLNPLNRLNGGQGIHTPNLGEISAELNLAVPKHAMNVVDALTVILTGGPASDAMDYVEPGFVLAGKDRVACDSVAVAILKHYGREMNIDRPYVDKPVWEQAQIKRGIELNLGRSAQNIDVVQEGIDNFSSIMDEWV